jgi:hypothetical protein
MNALLIAACLCVGPEPLVVCDTVDVIELNHLYDGEGREILHQWVFWEWDKHSADYRVVDWRLVKNEREGPRFAPGRARWVWLVCLDGQPSALRRIEARAFSESWTQVDVELRDREVWPTERRRLLLPPKCRIGRE